MKNVNQELKHRFICVKQGTSLTILNVILVLYFYFQNQT